MVMVLPQLMHRLVTDRQFRQQFLEDSEGALQSHGLSLTTEERQAVNAGIQALIERSPLLLAHQHLTLLSEGWASIGFASVVVAQ